MNDSNMSFDMGNGADFDVIEVGDNYSNTNENSVVTMLDYNEIELLFMGDLESSIENANLSKFQDVEVLKAGHHGSDTATSSSFLNKIKPETVIISASLNNQYGHPHYAALQRMLSVGSSIYGTFKSGNIVVTTDGYTYTASTYSKLTLADAGNSAPKITAPVPVVPVGTTTTDGLYCGSVKSDKFHYLDCRYVDTIAPYNLIYFKTREEAISNGYFPCKGCNP